MAVMNRDNGNPLAVGSAKGVNKWGVQDLIGNVWEWTSTEANSYPGSKMVIKPMKEKYYMLRGGGAADKSTGDLAITSTFRQAWAGVEPSKNIGFRLVRTK